MIYELRSYDIEPTRWDDYLNWAYTIAWPIIFGEFNFRLVSWWQVIPPADEPTPSTNLYWILAWDSEEEMRERRAALNNSEAWQAALAAASDPVTGERLYIRRTRSTLMQPLPRSPLT